MVPPETRSAEYPNVVHLIHFAADVDESARANIYRVDATPAVNDVSMVGAFALVASPLENIAPELCSIVHLLPPGPGTAAEDIL